MSRKQVIRLTYLRLKSCVAGAQLLHLLEDLGEDGSLVSVGGGEEFLRGESSQGERSWEAVGRRRSGGVAGGAHLRRVKKGRSERRGKRGEEGGQILMVGGEEESRGKPGRRGGTRRTNGWERLCVDDESEQKEGESRC